MPYNSLRYFSLVVITITLILVAGFRPIGFDPDSVAYSEFVLAFKGLNSIDIMDKEPGFWLLLYINKIFFENNVTSFLLLYAFLSISTKIILFNKLSSYPYLTILLYISTYFILHDMNQIRIGLACAILLWSLPNIIKRNPTFFFLKVLLATLFHYSAIIGIVFFFFRLDKINKALYLVAPIFCSAFLFFKDAVFQYSITIASYLPSFLSAKVNTYIALQEQGVFEADNLLIFNVGGFVVFCILLFFILAKKTSDNLSPEGKLETLLIKLLSLQLILGEVLSFNSELSNRFFTLLGFITIPLLLPKLTKYIKPSWIAASIVVLYASRQFYSSITGVFLY
nr:EpsG family protein [uncultured Lelliottia sp.]